MAPSYSERQAQYAQWRDRLRQKDEVIDLDAEPVDDPWDPKHLFQATPVDEVIDLDAGSVDASTTDPA